MPRTIPSALQTHLSGETLTTSILVLIERKDGVKLGFTSADDSIVYSGDTYYPSDSIGSSAISSEAGTGIDNMDVMGVIQDARVTEEDLLAGLYEGARVTVMLVNRATVSDGVVTLLKGRIGEITLEDGQFRAEVRSLAQTLKQSVGDATSKLCRVCALGDGQCKVNLAGTTSGGQSITNSKAVASVSGDGLTITFASDSNPTHHYRYGTVEFTTGLNDGHVREVKSHTLTAGQAVVVLRTAFPFAISPGDVATIIAGCDRTLDECRDKFLNLNNFHGEPEIPGNDKALKVGRHA